MPRRDRPEKRVVEPDLKYENIHVSMFVNRLMHGGKKSTAQGVLYDSFDLIEERASGQLLRFLSKLFKTLRLKSR